MWPIPWLFFRQVTFSNAFILEKILWKIPRETEASEDSWAKK